MLISLKEFKKAVKLIRAQSFMDAPKVVDAVRIQTIYLLKDNKCPQMALEISKMSLEEFTDFVINYCGDD